MTFVFFWLSSLSMIISRSIHVAVSGIISSFFMAEQYSIVYMYHIVFIQSSVDGHLGCFLVLAIVNSAAMNTGVRASFTIRIFIFSEYMPRSGIAGSHGSSRRRQWHLAPVLLPGESMDGWAWWAAVHGVARSQTWLSDFTFTFLFHVLEREMATHSNILAWRIPGMGSLVGCRLWGRTESDTTEAT